MGKTDFADGVRDVTPALPPNVPFGMLFGATAVEVGIGPVQATAMSLFVFAGAAQMAAVELLRTDAALPVVLATVLVLNLRYMIYGASLSPEVRHLPTRWRAVMGYGLSDVNYALAVAKFGGDPDASTESATDGSESRGDAAATRGSETAGVHEGWYYLGLTLPFVASFVIATAAGAVAGMSVGDGLSLEFAIPLIFIALLAPSVRGRVPVVVTALAAGIAVVTAGLPFNSGLLVAVGAGLVGGLLFERVDRLVGGDR